MKQSIRSIRCMAMMNRTFEDEKKIVSFSVSSSIFKPSLVNNKRNCTIICWSCSQRNEKEIEERKHNEKQICAECFESLGHD